MVLVVTISISSHRFDGRGSVLAASTSPETLTPMEMVEVTICLAASLHTLTGTHTASAVFHNYHVRVVFCVVCRFHPIMDVQTRLAVWMVKALACKAMLRA